MANVAEVGDESAAAVAIACLHDADRDIRLRGYLNPTQSSPKFHRLFYERPGTSFAPPATVPL